MEDNVQIFAGVFVSIFLLFIFPVYMAFEKKDDIAYALALRYTQNFVDTVKTKGYITKDMYAEYRKQLGITGNSYEVEMIHEQTRMDPIVQYYKKDAEGNLVLDKTTSQDEKRAEDERLLNLAITNPSLPIYEYSSEQTKRVYLNKMYKDMGYEKIIETYVVTKQTYETKYIEALIELENKLWIDATTSNFVCVDASEPSDLTASPKKINYCQNAYTLNENDLFTVKIKNTNITPATLIYNMITANTVKDNTRIYVNYGGVVLNARWYGKIDYTKMKHDDLDLYTMTLKGLLYKDKTVIYSKDGDIRTEDGEPADIEYFGNTSGIQGDKDYMIEIEARPFDTTDLQKVGYVIQDDSEIDRYNMAIGRNSSGSGLNVSIGINGICVLSVQGGNATVILSYPMKIDKFTKIRLRVGKAVSNPSRKEVILFVNDKRVAESILVNGNLGIWRIGQGYIDHNVGQYFSGAIRNTKVYHN